MPSPREGESKLAGMAGATLALSRGYYSKNNCPALNLQACDPLFAQSPGLLQVEVKILKTYCKHGSFRHEQILYWQADMAKRVLAALEQLTGCMLLLAAAPVLAAAALVITTLSKRSPFIAHLRVGQHGRALWMLKLRTMWDNTAALPSEQGWLERIVAEPSAVQKAREDVRVCSAFSAFCRRHSIDELPQLWHVVTGEMSLVGPRPLTATELAHHYGARISHVLCAKPGLTGLWQTQGRSALDWHARVSLDLDYLRSRSTKSYFSILYRTFPLLISGRGAW